MTSDPSPLKLRPALLFQMHRRAFYEIGPGNRDENPSTQAPRAKLEAARLAAIEQLAASSNTPPLERIQALAFIQSVQTDVVEEIEERISKLTCWYQKRFAILGDSI
ncbi:hypothetical protein [Labrys miyagiensis]|uniref:hypothetical protein n=1 Tax=Labrys miyagiensis TaxID=346912 RepID=UPI0024E18383|nr:hypothetical protein [Labrys miyagiensis]